ncbi:M23 family metallopeptidase [Reichenbachiella ulvae]|uniref:M23 family metallopeptidase n=1 Tax=Reichenbachiella ulvae TaxID=2980104 RepID=A0ABT3CWT9_9BACT|nr:M23 family metallopeptidase [Reichenbachiella ulvae]MCV9387673.1 M23 family metallopeptidase [Reichenbachiella ulvae]
MKTLNNNQILYISNDLKSKGLSVGFRSEVLDHLCCMMEEKLESGLSFSEAYQECLAAFGEQGFEELKLKSPITKKKEKTIMQQLLTSTIAASIFIFIFNTSVADKPSMHPINNEAVVTSSFGMRFDPISKKKKHHQGIDFRSELGTPIKASGDGEIIFAESDGRYGNKIIIKHDEEYQSTYSHLDEIKVSAGDLIKKGDIIGTVGMTGASTGPHLHYEVLKNGKPVDPASFITE